jgi:hypothetical protein
MMNNKTNEDQKYDVVVDVLTKHRNNLWDLSKNKEDWGMMDYIRMDQIHEIDRAIQLWKDHKKDDGADNEMEN